MGDKLQRDLEELQGELQRIDSKDPQLQELADELSATIAQTDGLSRSVLHSLQRAAEAFEVHHPKITALINQIMTSLSGLGI